MQMLDEVEGPRVFSLGAESLELRTWVSLLVLGLGFKAKGLRS